MRAFNYTPIGVIVGDFGTGLIMPVGHHEYELILVPDEDEELDYEYREAA